MNPILWARAALDVVHLVIDVQDSKLLDGGTRVTLFGIPIRDSGWDGVRRNVARREARRARRRAR